MNEQELYIVQAIKIQNRISVLNLQLIQMEKILKSMIDNNNNKKDIILLQKKYSYKYNEYIHNKKYLLKIKTNYNI